MTTFRVSRMPQPHMMSPHNNVGACVDGRQCEAGRGSGKDREAPIVPDASVASNGPASFHAVGALTLDG
jgi:hypothetical protein